MFADEKPDYLLISEQVLPALLEAGVTQEQIDQMMVANPVAFFGGSASRARNTARLGVERSGDALSTSRAVWAD